MKVKKIFITDNMPTANCHASTVLPLGDSKVLAAWFGGSKEGRDDVDIYYTIRDINSKASEIKKISVNEKLPHWNPVLFEHNDKSISLFFKVGKKIPLWRTYRSISFDRGLSFSAPEPLVKGDYSGGRGPVKNKCLRLNSGRVLAPASTENIGWNCFADISDDDGITFKKGKRIPTEYCAPLLNTENNHCRNKIPMIQPTFWESESGVHALMRTSVGFIYRADSADGGNTWCEAYSTGLPNNNSGIDIAKDDKGKLYLVSNPVGENWGERSPLTVQISDDDGKTFRHFLTLEEEKKDSEFSYPAIVYKNGHLYITYTWERKNIALCDIEL